MLWAVSRTPLVHISDDPQERNSLTLKSCIPVECHDKKKTCKVNSTHVVGDMELNLNLIVYNKMLHHEHQILILGKTLKWNDDKG